MKSKAMKKFLALMLTAATVLSMTACGGSASGEANVSGLDENGKCKGNQFSAGGDGRIVLYHKCSCQLHTKSK